MATRYTKQRAEKDEQLLLDNGLIGVFKPNRDLVKQLCAAVVSVQDELNEERIDRHSVEYALERERSRSIWSIMAERIGRMFK